MPKKRIRFKKKFILNYARLTEDLYDAICKCVSFEEFLEGYKHLGYKYGNYFVMFDKNDPKVCRRIWNLHKKAVMEKWKTDPKNNAGRRPFLWWICERSEDIKFLRFEKHTNERGEPEPIEDIYPDGHTEFEFPIYESETAYLKRLNLLEAWEIKALGERGPHFQNVEETDEDELPYYL